MKHSQHNTTQHNTANNTTKHTITKTEKQKYSRTPTNFKIQDTIHEQDTNSIPERHKMEAKTACSFKNTRVCNHSDLTLKNLVLIYHSYKENTFHFRTVS